MGTQEQAGLVGYLDDELKYGLMQLLELAGDIDLAQRETVVTIEPMLEIPTDRCGSPQYGAHEATREHWSRRCILTDTRIHERGTLAPP